jgi:hypothetical protein
MKIKPLASLAGVLAIAVLSPSAAPASPMLWTDAGKTTPLRDLEGSPPNYPDILEFANQRPVVFSAEFPTGKVRAACKELELSTTVIINNGVEETTLSVPFGVFEGDQCLGSDGSLVPTRFQALPPGEGTGVVGVAPKTTALMTITGSKGSFVATLDHLRVWQDIAGKFCAWNLDQVHGLVENVTEGFVEDAPPNLSLRFPAVEVPITNAPHATGCPSAGRFSADLLFLETMSTATDTAFVG